MLFCRIGSKRFFLGLAALFIVFCAAPSRAERLPIRNYTTSDGLANNRVGRIIPDSRGFLWFCTPDGLSRFDGHSFKNYSTQDGLPFPSVTDLLDTSTGEYWISTNGGGVVRFDMKGQEREEGQVRHTVYTIGHTQASNRVNLLHRDRAGKIWAGTDGGLFVLDLQDGQPAFQSVHLGVPSHPDEFVQVWAIFEDQQNNFWIGTKFGLLKRLADGRVIQYIVHPSSTSDHIFSILEDAGKRLWLGHQSGLVIFNPGQSLDAEGSSLSQQQKNITERLRIKKITFNANQYLQPLESMPEQAGEAHFYTITSEESTSRVSMLLKSADGTIWIGTIYGGLIEFQNGGFRTHTLVQGLKDKLIQCVAEDREGNLWVGTVNGVMRIARNGFILYDEADGLGQIVGAIFETRAGELCTISTPFSINRFDGRRFNTIRPALPDHILNIGLRSNQVHLQDRAGNWWISTREGLYRFPKADRVDQLSRMRPTAFYTTRDGLADNDITRLYEDRNGDLWIGAFSPGREVLTRWNRATEKFYHYSDTDGLKPYNAPTAFAEDDAGNLWVGFRGGGLARFKDGRFSLFKDSEGSTTGYISSLYLDKSGTLWGTSVNGLIRTDNPTAENPSFLTYTSDDGLSGNNLSVITGDTQGNIYVASLQGIDRLDTATGRIRQYSVADGLVSNEFIAAFCDSQGRLWFGTTKGLLRLIPQPEQPRQPPSIWIASVLIAGIPQPVSELGETNLSGLEAEPDQNQIQISFFGIDFGPGVALRYQYKLIGSDKEWSTPIGQRVINYASLAPGTYRFMVRAMSSDGSLSPLPASIDFTVLRPIWQRWWFVVMITVALVSVALFFERSRSARVKALSDSENRFRALAETASDAIFAIDEKSHVAFANPAAESMFGFSNSEIIGIDMSALIPGYERPLRFAVFGGQDSLLDFSWETRELHGIHKTGSHVPLELSFGQFTRDDRRFYTIIARDVTERKQAEEALRKSKEERLAELQRVRRRIATDLHDDIGSSLTKITLLSELVRQKLNNDGEDVAEPLDSISCISNELVESMSDIVWAINPQKDNISDLLQRMRRFASDMFAVRKIAFRFFASGINNEIQLGANIRREVFLIFKETVNNIVKHSQCTETISEFEIKDGWLRLQLKDNGKGFDPSFAKADTGYLSSQLRGGNGLASIRKRAAELGGELHIETAPGAGTIVELHVPITPPSPAS